MKINETKLLLEGLSNLIEIVEEAQRLCYDVIGNYTGKASATEQWQTVDRAHELLKKIEGNDS